MLFSIDRKMGGKAVLVGEDGKPLEVSLSMLPKGAKEGDMLWYEKGGFTPAPDKAAQRRQRVSEALEVLLRQRDEEE